MTNEIIVMQPQEDWYISLVDDCKAIITEAVFNSRWELVIGYHQLGKRIVEEVNLNREDIYGKKILTGLSESSGIHERDLYRSIQFYKKYPDMNTLPEGKNISWNKIITKYLPKNGPHVSNNSGENEWYTPPEFIISAREVLGSIDTDPASSDKANEIVQAAKYYTKDRSGLDLRNKWSGNVWMNPPYASNLIGKFIDRYAAEVTDGNIYGIVLVNNATETDWFLKLVSVSNAVVFVNKRIKFIDVNGSATGSPLQGQALLYSGEQSKKFLKEFEKFGWGASW